MKKNVIGLVALAGTATAGISHAAEFRLQGEYWGNITAPNGWMASDGSFGLLPGDNDDARATALCESAVGSPCYEVRLQDVDTKGPVQATVRSFDGSGRRLYIGAGGSLWATGESQVAGVDFSGGQLTTSSQFTIGKLKVNDGGVNNPSVMTAPNSGVFILRDSADVQGTLDFRSTRGETRNDGTLTQSGVGNMSLWFGHDFRNRAGGVVDFQNDNGIAVRSPDFDQGLVPMQFINEAGATVKKTGGSGTSTIAAPVFNAGKVSAASGTLRLSGGGTHSAGATLEGSGGSVQLIGAHRVTGAVTTSGLAGVVVVGGATLSVANGGVLSNAGRLYLDGTLGVESGGKLDNGVDGQFYLGAGSITTVASGGRLDNAGYQRLDGTLINNGDVTFKSGAFGQGADTGRYTQNAGSTTIESGATFGLDGGSYVQHGGQTAITAGAFLILGAYDSNNDTYVGGEFLQTAGTTTVNGLLDSDSMKFGGGTLAGSGTLRGNVTFEPATGNVFSGTISPGNSPGILTVEGNFMATSAIFNFEIGGYEAGSEFDQLFVTGDATIKGGQVNFFFINGFRPEEGRSFQWLKVNGGIDLLDLLFATNLEGFEFDLDGYGNFLVTNAPDGGGGGPGNPVPEPGTLALLGLGLAALRLSRRRTCDPGDRSFRRRASRTVISRP